MIVLGCHISAVETTKKPTNGGSEEMHVDREWKSKSAQGLHLQAERERNTTLFLFLRFLFTGAKITFYILMLS